MDVTPHAMFDWKLQAHVVLSPCVDSVRLHLLCPFGFPNYFSPLRRRRKPSLGQLARGQGPLIMAKKKGTKRGRQAEAAAAQDVYEAEDEQPAEEKPNKARKRYDVSAPMHAQVYLANSCPPALLLLNNPHQLLCAA